MILGLGLWVKLKINYCFIENIWWLFVIFPLQTASWLRQPRGFVNIQTLCYSLNLLRTKWVCLTPTRFDVKRVICEVLFFIERARLQQNKWCLKKGELDIVYKVLHLLFHVPFTVFQHLNIFSDYIFCHPDSSQGF